MLNKDTQEQSLDSYFAGLMLGASEALWAESEPETAQEAKSGTPAAQAKEPKACLPNRQAEYMHVIPVSVVGLKLALPTEAVAQILPFPQQQAQGDAGRLWSDHVLPAQPRLRVIDTARVVVPRAHPRYEALVTRKAYRHLIVLNGGGWAIAADLVDEEVILPSSALCWRDVPGQDHPWLAATFRDFGYALVDVSRLVELVQATGT